NHDTDGDGLTDGVERGNTSPVPGGTTPSGVVFSGTDTNSVRYKTDLQPASTTHAHDPDHDNDGLCDGPNTVSGVCIAGEDSNANGRLDATETNPLSADSDGDTANDLLEVQTLLTDPRDGDTDNDGIQD